MIKIFGEKEGKKFCFNTRIQYQRSFVKNKAANRQKFIGYVPNMQESDAINVLSEYTSRNDTKQCKSIKTVC